MRLFNIGLGLWATKKHDRCRVGQNTYSTAKKNIETFTARTRDYLRLWLGVDEVYCICQTTFALLRSKLHLLIVHFHCLVKKVPLPFCSNATANPRLVSAARTTFPRPFGPISNRPESCSHLPFQAARRLDYMAAEGWGPVSGATDWKPRSFCPGE